MSGTLSPPLQRAAVKTERQFNIGFSILARVQNSYCELFSSLDNAHLPGMDQQVFNSLTIEMQREVGKINGTVFEVRMSALWSPTAMARSSL